MAKDNECPTCGSTMPEVYKVPRKGGKCFCEDKFHKPKVKHGKG